MNKCGDCESRAIWKCTTCNLLLCSMHKPIHCDDEYEHSITKLKFKVPEHLKQNALDSVNAKICLIDQFSNQIIKSSKIIIEQLNILSKAILSNLKEQRKKYLQILHFFNTEMMEDQLKMIEKEVAAVLVYEKCESRESWYDKEILKESASASNRREEHFRLGRDLVNEVVKRTLIYLETSNSYAGQIGTIEDVNFIYHGEIENRLRHGVGKCDYFKSGVYNGEFQNGKKEGRGVYKYVNGDIYDGEWKNGLSEGRGVYKFANGDIYDGECKAGNSEGRGVKKWCNGDIYDGEWKANLKEGRGVQKYANGYVYDGKWKAGEKCT